ncbi:MAG: SCP2 sterol-binding domain-containing protein [Candidatus Bathyarchaeia archaeon]
MTKLTELKNFLSRTVEAINQNRKAREIILKSTQHFPGIIFQFHADNSKFYLVFFADGHAELIDGYYPSSDVHIIANSDVMFDFLTGKVKLKNATESGTLYIEGELHQTNYLLQALATTLK